MKIVIIGAGLTGLCAALSLEEAGHDVIVLEKEGYAGGLSSSVLVDGVWIERYYHHMFKSDTNMMELLVRLGIANRLLWKPSSIGYHSAGGNHPFGTPWDLLFYPGLSLIDKACFGLIILRMRFMKDWRSLDGISARRWLQRNGTKSLLEGIWLPLLKAKFGKLRDSASAAWLWGRINPRSKSRNSSMSREYLGYLDGGFIGLFDELTRRLKDVRLGTEAKRVVVMDGRVKGVEVESGRINADAVLHTGSLAQLGVIADLPDEYADALGRIGYRAVACALFKLKRRYDRFYWLNNGDDSLFIGGIIEHTNFVDEEAYGGHMVYAFAYLDPDDTMLNDTKALRDIFLRDMKAISPTFDSGDVVSVVISSNRYATPVYDVGYLQKMPKVKTPIEGLFLAGMTGVYPMDRNMDNAINAGFEAAGVIGDSFLKK